MNINPRTNPKILRQVSRTLKKTSPTLLTCVGAVGVVITAALAVKATPKALELIDKAKTDKMAENEDKMTRIETIEACWKCYVPAGIAGISTIGCIFGANVLTRRQQASLVSAYAFISRSYSEYKQKVKELYGEEAHKKIIKSLAVEKPDAPYIYGSMTGKDFSFEEMPEELHMFYDSFSKRYFQATPSQVLLAEMHVNRNFALNGGEVLLQEFYNFLGLDTPEDMKDLAWFISDCYYWIDFVHSKMFIDDGLDREPIECYIIEMEYPPTLEPLEC